MPTPPRINISRLLEPTTVGMSAAAEVGKGVFAPRTPLSVVGDAWRGLGSLFERIKGRQTIVAVQLASQADLSSLASMPRGPERRAAAWELLSTHAANTQPAFEGVLQQWKRQGLVKGWEAHALGNTFEITLNERREKDLLKALNRRRDVGVVVPMTPLLRDASQKPANPGKKILADAVHPPARPFDEDGIAWHLNAMGAPAAWEQGIDGTGVRVGVLDTGVDDNHPALATAFPQRGESIDYRWDTGGQSKSRPHDSMGHGMHVSGIIAGSEDGRRTGVAPGVELIESSLRDSLVEPLQWLLAPTDRHGRNPDPRRGADIISNSWGLQGKLAPIGRILEQPLRQLDDAGMVMVFAAGNDGSKSNTMNSPSTHPDAIAVAATNSKGGAASFSSRGKIDAQGRLIGSKPDIAAPGAAIPSLGKVKGTNGALATMSMMRYLTGGVDGEVMAQGPVDGTDGRYWFMSGTSMATPATAGALALMLQQHPEFSPDDVRAVLARGAIDQAPAGRDAMYGAGSLRIPEMLAAADAHAAEAAAAAKAAGGTGAAA